jgi:inosine-uridine nucleoside N-ribohydrolase
MTIPAEIVRRFPKLSEDDLRRLLALPKGRVRMILDTDAANEIDDQFAIAWSLLSPEHIDLEGVTIEPYSILHKRADFLETEQIMKRGGARTEWEAVLVGRYGRWIEGHWKLGRNPEKTEFVTPSEGADRSYDEAVRVFEKVGADPKGTVLRGSSQFLTSLDQPLRTPSAERIIERALASSDRPLYVSAIGCVTNIASAMLLEPAIIRNLVVVWTSGFPTTIKLSNEPSLNLFEDVLASQLLFASGMAHVYLPGYHVGAQLRISLPEMERWVKGRGTIGDYLHYLYTNNPLHHMRAVTDRERLTWVMWDIINIAWLINPEWVPTHMTRSPLLGDDLHWQPQADGHLMREAHAVDRDAIFADFYTKLDRAAG